MYNVEVEFIGGVLEGLRYTHMCVPYVEPGKVVRGLGSPYRVVACWWVPKF